MHFQEVAEVGVFSSLKALFETLISLLVFVGLKYELKLRHPQ